MKTIYISPHLDDVVFSCGGWIWEQTSQGQEVEVWTVCAGDPPPGRISSLAQALHESWNLDADWVQTRRKEDLEACRMIGAVPRHLPFLDCIYRTSEEGDFYYQTEVDLFGGLDPNEGDLIDRVSEALGQILPDEAELVVPLGIGNHVDHDLTRKAAARLKRKLRYYADYPYARDPQGQEILEFIERSPEWGADNLKVTDRGLEVWWNAARAYRSQISTFWEDESALGMEIREFSSFLGGLKLWEALEGDD